MMAGRKRPRAMGRPLGERREGALVTERCTWGRAAAVGLVLGVCTVTLTWRPPSDPAGWRLSTRPPATQATASPPTHVGLRETRALRCLGCQTNQRSARGGISRAALTQEEPEALGDGGSWAESWLEEPALFEARPAAAPVQHTLAPGDALEEPNDVWPVFHGGNGGRAHVFVGGLQRSATTFVSGVLERVPCISGMTAPGDAETMEAMEPWKLHNFTEKYFLSVVDTGGLEGKFVQTVYPYYNFHKFANLHGIQVTKIKSAVLAAEAAGNAREKLMEQWGVFWDTSKPTLLEKTPENIIYPTFLQDTFGRESTFIFSMRHPLCWAMAIHKWMKTDNYMTKLRDVVALWLTAHQLMLHDLPQLEKVIIVHNEAMGTSGEVWQHLWEGLVDHNAVPADCPSDRVLHAGTFHYLQIANFNYLMCWLAGGWMLSGRDISNCFLPSVGRRKNKVTKGNVERGDYENVGLSPGRITELVHLADAFERQANAFGYSFQPFLDLIGVGNGGDGADVRPLLLAEHLSRGDGTSLVNTGMLHPDSPGWHPLFKSRSILPKGLEGHTVTWDDFNTKQNSQGEEHGAGGAMKTGDEAKLDASTLPDRAEEGAAAAAAAGVPVPRHILLTVNEPVWGDMPKRLPERVHQIATSLALGAGCTVHLVWHSGLRELPEMLVTRQGADVRFYMGTLKDQMDQITALGLLPLLDAVVLSTTDLSGIVAAAAKGASGKPLAGVGGEGHDGPWYAEPSRPLVEQMISRRLLEEAAQAPQVLLLDMLHHEKVVGMLNGDAAEHTVDVARWMKERETCLVQQSDAVAVLAESDLQVVQAMVAGSEQPSPRIGLVSLSGRAKLGNPTPFSSRSQLLCMGRQGVEAGVAMRWMLANVNRKVVEALGKEQGFMVLIGLGWQGPTVGTVMREARKEGMVNHSEMLSHEDIEHLYTTSKVAVVPAALGSGMSHSTLLAMTRGVPVVTTSEGVRGLAIPEEVLEDTVLVRDDPGQFAEAVVRLCEDQALWEKLSLNAMEHVRGKLTPGKWSRSFMALIDNATQDRTKHPTGRRRQC